MSEADALDVEGRNYASFKIRISQVGIKFNSKMTVDTAVTLNAKMKMLKI